MTFSTIPNAQSSAGWLDWGINSIGALGRQASDGLSELGQSFGSLLSGDEPPAGAETAGKTGGPRAVATSSPDTALESGLLSSLGLSSVGDGAESLGAMQQNLLSALQSSLVASQATPETVTPDIPADFSLTDSVMDYSFGEDGVGITDAFDTFNVLNHVPVVSALYQDETGTQINAVAKLAGGYMYGGPLGLTLSAVDLGVEALSGASFNDRLLSLDVTGLFDWSASVEEPTQAAAVAPLQSAPVEPVTGNSGAAAGHTSAPAYQAVLKDQQLLP